MGYGRDKRAVVENAYSPPYEPADTWITGTSPVMTSLGVRIGLASVTVR